MDIDHVPTDAKSKEVVRLWRAWRTVHEMVADRVRKRSLCRSLSRQSRFPPPLTMQLTKYQEYELAEEEVKISLDRFRDEYCNPDGSVK